MKVLRNLLYKWERWKRPKEHTDLFCSCRKCFDERRELFQRLMSETRTIRFRRTNPFK